MINRFHFCLFLLCVSLSAGSHTFPIKRLGVHEGLSNNHVVSIVQDKEGFLWLATEEGLNRFDGLRFHTYYKEEANLQAGLSGNELNALLDDPVDSVLWIATQRAGLNAYNYAQQTFHTYRHEPDNPHSLITDDITHVIADGTEGLWISTYWHGVEHFDKSNGNFTHYNSSTLPCWPDDQVWTVAAGGDDCLYIGHVLNGFSILSVRERKIQNFRHDPTQPHSLPGNEVFSICPDNRGNVWVGTDGGLALFHAERGEFITYDDAQGSLRHRVYDIRLIDDRWLWVATELGGIVIIDLTLSQHHASADAVVEILQEGDYATGLSNPSIRCLCPDRFGNVWAGTWGGGVNFIRREPLLFQTFRYSPLVSAPTRLDNKIATSLCFDEQGRLWVGTDGGGINLFHANQRVGTYNVRGGHLASDHVQASFCDSQGGLWFGLFYAGVAYYDPQRGRFSRLLDRAPQADVRSFHEDVAHGIIYVCTSQGVYLVDRDSRRVTAHHDCANNLARCALIDAHRQVWIGFFGGGLALYDEEFHEVRRFMVTDGFPSNTINALFLDSRGRLWVATGEGLVCFPQPDQPQWRVYRRVDGLANAHIQALAEDEAGNIWFSTNQGISCLLDGQDTFFHYSYNDHLPVGSFSRGCAARSTDGTLYFGSIDGVCLFRPYEVLRQRQAPPARLLEMSLHSPLREPVLAPRRVALHGRQEVSLPYQDNSFSLHFNVADYALESEVEYAYRLVGLDGSWYTVNTPNSVTYRNLQPGNYTFMVKTRLHNQAWSPEIARLNIVVHPPFYLTGWALALYVLLGAGFVGLLGYIYLRRLKAESLYALEHQRRQQEQELNDERLHFYTNITHELRTPLSLLVGPLDDLQQDHSLPPEATQKVAFIHKSAHRLLYLINQLLEFRKVETHNRPLSVSRGDLVMLVREIGLKYQALNNKPQVSIVLDLPSSQELIWFDPSVVQTVLENLLSNAQKYTSQGSVTLRILHEEHQGVAHTCIQVSDTGCGIDPSALPYIFDRYYQASGRHQACGTGIGLSLVQSLVHLHQGEIRAESTPQVGSTFTFCLQTDCTYPEARHLDASAGDVPSLPAPEGQADTSRPVLLVVDDNPDMCDYLAGSLSPYYEVRIAHDGQEGLDAVAKSLPDIIVSDIMMPVMDGIEMTRRLKGDVQTSHIPIILLTAKDTPSDKEEGYQTGADSYLTKPFNISLLRTRMDNLLQSRRQLAHLFGTHAVTHAKAVIMTDSLSQLDRDFLQRIDALVEERLSQDKIDVSYLADKLCMSNSTLYRKMKVLTGLSTNEYIRKLRMSHAERLLLEGKYTVSEIADKVGFSNLFYFRQCFKEEFGYVPTEYIKHLRAKEESTSESL